MARRAAGDAGALVSTPEDGGRVGDAVRRGLLAAAGRTNREVAAEVGCHLNAAVTWRKRPTAAGTARRSAAIGPAPQPE
jgi:hypothetical protein